MIGSSGTGIRLIQAHPPQAHHSSASPKRIHPKPPCRPVVNSFMIGSDDAAGMGA
jgi:hypothetical protein